VETILGWHSKKLRRRLKCWEMKRGLHPPKKVKLGVIKEINFEFN
jgi:hypothetical protein